MIEELITCFLSLVSLVTSDPPQVSRDNIQDESSLTTSEGNEENDLLWTDKIHREYERENGRQVSQYPINEDLLYNYVSIGNQGQTRRSICQSIKRSLEASVTILLAVFPIGILGIGLLYLELNTTDLCFDWKQHNHSIPYDVKRWRLIGEDIEVVFLQMWFPVILMLVFGWKEFKSNCIGVVYISFVAAAVIVIYKTFLLVFGVFGTKDYYIYPGNIVYVLSVFFGNILVVRKIHTAQPSIPRRRVFVLISTCFIAGLFLAFTYRYGIVPLFNRLENQTAKFLVAAMAPIVTLLPTAICKYLALRRSAGIVEPERCFFLVYFLHGAAICLYRIMQADFKGRWLFIGLSLVSGFSNLARKATQGIRDKLWTRIIQFLRTTVCCTRLQQIPSNTPHHRRFRADIEIQDMLYEYTTIIMSQAYFVFYLITSYEIPVWPVFQESLIRITIGLGIDFVLNWISIFIQIHFYDIPIRRVWLKYWKRHMVANVLMLVETLCYFSRVLFSVFQVRMDSSMKYTIRNCTLPFKTR